MLSELCQSVHYLGTPQYRCSEESGGHICRCTVYAHGRVNGFVSKGKGRNKKEAKEAAAAAVYGPIESYIIDRGQESKKQTVVSSRLRSAIRHDFLRILRQADWQHQPHDLDRIATDQVTVWVYDRVHRLWVAVYLIAITHGRLPELSKENHSLVFCVQPRLLAVAARRPGTVEGRLAGRNLLDNLARAIRQGLADDPAIGRAELPASPA